MNAYRISLLIPLVVVYSSIIAVVQGFQPAGGCQTCFCRAAPRQRLRHHHHLAASQSTADSDDNELLEELRSMRVKQLKEELQTLKVPFDDVFEKEQLVERLLNARKHNENNQKEGGAATTTTKSTATDTASTSSAASSSVLTFPLILTTETNEISLADSGVTMKPSDQAFYTIALDITSSSSSSSSNKQKHTLRLLLDTACTGLVLRPEVVAKYGLPLRDTPVTMTGAGGTGAAGTPGLSEVNLHLNNNDMVLERQPAAVQDIGGLPPSLDGIIGLQFLGQFQAVDMDLEEGVTRLYRNTPASIRKGLTQVAKAKTLHMLSLGIYATDLYLGGRGPVRVLIDSGAASTFLTWKGVSDLGLDRTSPAIQPIRNMGAVGSDNVALALTHRLHVSSMLQLDKDNDVGLSLSADSDDTSDSNDDGDDQKQSSSRRLPIDIGDIPVVQQMEREGLGGILGMDVMRRCKMVRFSCREPREFALYN